MKKIAAAFVYIMMLIYTVSLSVSAASGYDGAAAPSGSPGYASGSSGVAIAPIKTFGSLTYKSDNGFILFSEGGQGDCNSFGFALSDGEKTIHLYQVCSDFEKPYSVHLKGLAVFEIEIRQFAEIDGEMLYGEPLYVTYTSEPVVKTMEQVKAEMLAELNESVDKTLYRDTEKMEIERITADAEQAINAAERKYTAKEVLAYAKTQFALFKTDKQYYSEELAQLKETSISELNSFADKSLYRDAEKAEIEKIIVESTTTINTAEKKEDVTSAVESAKLQISGLKTDKQLYEEELNLLKATSIAELNGIVDKSLYRDAEKAEIDSIIAETCTVIDNAENKEDVTSAVESAKVHLLALKTDEQYYAEELGLLKETSITELNGFVDKSLYRDAEKAEIERIISEATEKINACTAKEDVSDTLQSAKESISALLTAEQLDKYAAENEEVVGYLKKAIVELKAETFSVKGYKIVGIVMTVMEDVIEDGEYGRILITDTYIKETYSAEIAQVKAIYNSMEETWEKPNFEGTLASMDAETAAFLKEYFL